MMFVRTLILLFLAVTAVPAVADTERRIALVVGNGAYRHVDHLPNPPRDAAGVAAALRRVGFDVIETVDADREEFRAALRRFSERLAGAQVGLFFYAGHGMQVGAQNYLLPVDAALAHETDLSFEAISLQLVLDLMERTPRTSLVFLDACRDNPLARNLARSLGASRSAAVGSGLASVTASIGMLVAYATQPGNVALDGEGGNSPFTRALIESLETPGLEVRALMTEVRRSVIEETGGRQVPWDHSSLTGPFYFADAPPDPPRSDPAPDPPAAGTETELWRAVEDSGDPELLEHFLEQFPDGVFAPVARKRLAALRAPDDPAPKGDAGRRDDTDGNRGTLSQAAARDVVETFLGLGNLGADQIRRIYGEQVAYYGSGTVPVDEVVRDKLRYFRRWPERIYTLDPATVRASRADRDGTRIEIAYEYEFQVRAPGRARNGRATGVLTVDVGGPALRIVGEAGEVIERW